VCLSAEAGVLAASLRSGIHGRSEQSDSLHGRRTGPLGQVHSSSRDSRLKGPVPSPSRRHSATSVRAQRPQHKIAIGGRCAVDVRGGARSCKHGRPTAASVPRLRLARASISRARRSLVAVLLSVSLHSELQRLSRPSLARVRACELGPSDSADGQGGALTARRDCAHAAASSKRRSLREGGARRLMSSTQLRPCTRSRRRGPCLLSLCHSSHHRLRSTLTPSPLLHSLLCLVRPARPAQAARAAGAGHAHLLRHRRPDRRHRRRLLRHPQPG
jgi:hypothetical protein